MRKLITVCALILMLVGCTKQPLEKPSKNYSAPTAKKATKEKLPGEGLSFNNDSFTTVLRDPDSNKGAQVEITGEVFDYFVKPGPVGKKYPGLWQFQIWVKPDSKDHTDTAPIIVGKGNFDVKNGDYVRIKGVVLAKSNYTVGSGDEIRTALIDAFSKSGYKTEKIDISEALGPITSRKLDEVTVSEYKRAPNEEKLRLINRYLDEKTLRQSGMPWQDANWLFSTLEAYLQKTTIENSAFGISSELDMAISSWRSDNETSNIQNLRFSSSIDYVKALLGEPDDSQHSESAGLPVSDYLYYGDWQLAFDDGKLTAKNQN